MNTSRVKEHVGETFFLCAYTQWRDTWKSEGPINRGFRIIKPLKNKYIPEEIEVTGEYFVIEVVRRFTITKHVHAPSFSHEELEI